MIDAWSEFIQNDISQVASFFSAFFDLIPREIFYLLLFIPSFGIVYAIARYARHFMR